MRTYLDKDTGMWVSYKPDKYWSGLRCMYTGERIFSGDALAILNARGHDKPVIFKSPDCLYHDTHTYIYRRYFKIIKCI